MIFTSRLTRKAHIAEFDRNILYYFHKIAFHAWHDDVDLPPPPVDVIISLQSLQSHPIYSRDRSYCHINLVVDSHFVCNACCLIIHAEYVCNNITL